MLNWQAEEPRSYYVETTNGNILRRNQNHIRDAPPAITHTEIPRIFHNVKPISIPQTVNNTDQCDTPPMKPPSQNQSQTNDNSRTRSGRLVVKPVRYQN